MWKNFKEIICYLPHPPWSLSKKDSKIVWFKNFLHYRQKIIEIQQKMNRALEGHYFPRKFTISFRIKPDVWRWSRPFNLNGTIKFGLAINDMFSQYWYGILYWTLQVLKYWLSICMEYLYWCLCIVSAFISG